MAGGNSSPQVVEGPYTKMVMVDQYGRWQLFTSSCGQDHIPRLLWWINMAGGNSSPQVVDRTIYQDGYGGSIWPVAALRLKLWTEPYTKIVMVDQYSRWQLYASSCGKEPRQSWIWWINMTQHLKLLTDLWIPWWIWWPMINNLVQILRTFLSC